MPFRIGRKTLQQFEALLPTLMSTDTSMRLIDNYKPGQTRAKVSRRLSALM